MLEERVSVVRMQNSHQEHDYLQGLKDAQTPKPMSRTQDGEKAREEAFREADF